MDQDIIEKFNRVLEKRRLDVSSRFRITEIDEATVREMLSLCYKKEVDKRKITYQADTEIEQHISRAAKWLCQDLKTGLLLYGGVGNGKTTLANAICELIRILYGSACSSNRKGVRMVSALDLAKSMTGDLQFLDNIKNLELLFLDDVGTEPASVKSWGNEFSPVTDLLYNRYNNQLFTIFTSNLNDKELMERYGVRIADRMKEMFNKIYFSSKSYRI